MATQIQLRHDSGSIWTLVNPILAQGELGIELDTTNIKVGDGITSWNNLSYIKFISSSFALTASYAMNGGGGGGGGQSVSSSWASASISSSFALTASYALNGGGGGGQSLSSSWASASISSSFALTASYAMNGGGQSLSSSWASASISSSFASVALTASYISASNLPPHTASWATSLVNFPFVSSQSIVLTNTQSQYNIFTYPTRSCSSAVYNYSVFSGSNGRAGHINAIFINNLVSWNDVACTPIGTTTDITTSVVLNGNNVNLYAAASSSLNWQISATATYL